MTGLPEGFVLDAAPERLPATPARVTGTNPPSLPDGFALDAPAPTVSVGSRQALPDIDDPKGPLYAQRHGGGVVTGLVDMAGKVLSRGGRMISGEIPVFGSDGHVTDEAVQQGLDTALLFNPVPQGITTAGKVGISREAQQAWTGRQRSVAETLFPSRPVATSPAPTAAVTEAPAIMPSRSTSIEPASATTHTLQAADRIGVTVPVGVASDNTALQAVTQAARSMPFGGARIENAVSDSLKSLSGAADRAATTAARVPEGSIPPTAEAAGASARAELQNAVAQREALAARDTERLQAQAPAGASREAGVLGDDIKTGLEARIAANKREQQSGYDQLRAAINPVTKVDISDDLVSTLQAIAKARSEAAQPGMLPSTLTPALDLATRPKGASFDGLQRARSTLGEQIDFEAAKGFDTSDLKRAYGALTDAMHTAAGEVGSPLLRKADERFGILAEQNADLRQVVGGGSEALVNRLIGYANEKGGGNVARLRQLQASIPDDSRASLSRLAFQRLGSDATGAFDLDRFAQGYSAMSQQGRTALFGNRVGAIERAMSAAQKTSGESAAANADVLRLLGSSDEQLARRLVQMGSSGATADHAMLSRMSSIMGPQAMGDVGSLAIQGLGLGRTGEFSPAIFSSNWNRLSDAGKGLLFRNPELRRSLDDIAMVSSRMADVERRFKNSSGTARAGATAGLVAGLFVEPMTVIGSVVGGEALGRILSRPATARAAADWSKAYLSASTNAEAQQELRRATKALAAASGLPITFQAVVENVKGNRQR